MDRRTFLKTAATTGIVFTLNPEKILKANSFGGTGYFGIHTFIENNPEAVFIMRTNVDKKTNSTAMKSAGTIFAQSVIVSKNENETGAVPITHKIAIKPNLTLKFHWDSRFTVEGTMGINTDAHFVEGIIEIMKAQGIAGEQIYLIETNYDHEDLMDGGYLDMVERTGVHLKDLSAGLGNIDESNIVWKDVENGGYFRRIPYIFPVNAPNSWLINIAKFKAHSMGITGCAKNLQGTVVKNYQEHCRTISEGDLVGMDDEDKVPDAFNKIMSNYQSHKDVIPRWDKPGKLGGLWQETWATRCLDNNSVINAGLHVIEGIYGRDGDFISGPSLGDDIEDGLATDYMTNVIIFGKNPFNVDIIAHWLAGHEPGNFGLFHLAIERGLSAKLNPMDIPVYEWKADGSAILTSLTDFERTPLKTKYLQRNYNGQNEPYWHLCNEPYNYEAASTQWKTNGKNLYTFKLKQNYPNPFNPRTTIEYQIAKPVHACIEIYDTRGRLIEILVDKYHMQGHHMVVWDASRYPSGTYFYRLRTGSGYQITKKMELVK